MRRLAGNLKNMGVFIAETLQHDWLAGPLPEFYQQRFPGGIDRILIDAPCSNTGVMRRRVDVRWRLQPDDFVKMQQQQLRLLDAIAPNLKSAAAWFTAPAASKPRRTRARPRSSPPAIRSSNF